MGRDVRRRVTGTAAAAAVLLLVFGAFGFVRTATNSERVHDRNLRELSRIGGSVEGTINNLPTVLQNLTDQVNGRAQPDPVELIPHLSMDTTDRLREACSRDAGGPAARYGARPAADTLRLCYIGARDEAPILAKYDLAGVRQALNSLHFENVFVADERGTVFLRGPQRGAVRVDDLATIDTLRARLPVDTLGVGVTRIVRAPIAGRDYFFYLLPLRIGMGAAGGTEAGSREESRWMVGGLVRASAHRQESLSLHPRAALVLGFLVVLTILAAPFVRVFTIGPRERLGVGHLLYLVLALILATGLVGLGLADLAHHRQLERTTYRQLDRTADALAANIEAEIDAALVQIDALTAQFERSVHEALPEGRLADRSPLDPELRDTLSSIFMQPAVRPDTLPYPAFQMAFWTDSTGWQRAKWTPRQRNTPRIRVADREYFRALREGRGWPARVELTSALPCPRIRAGDENSSGPGQSRYAVEFIRSWTTGEKLAVIATDYCWPGPDTLRVAGIAALTTELVSLRAPVLPAGVGAALVAADGRTLASTLPDRGLEEYFAEETDRASLVQSILSARAAREVDVKYGVRHTRLVIRPLADRPLFLVTFYDRSLLDAVGFAAWFMGGALFGTLALGFLALVLLADRIEPTRIGWLWPELDSPGKYVAFLAMTVPFLAALTAHAFAPDSLPIEGSTLLIPMLFLGLGLVVLSTPAQKEAGAIRERGATLGWALYGIGFLSLVAMILITRRVVWMELLPALAGLLVTAAWTGWETLRNSTNGIDRYVRPRVLYTAALVSGLLVVSLLPGYLSYQVAFRDAAARLVRHHHLHVLEGLRTREIRQDSLLRRIARPEDADRAALRASGLDLAFRGLVYETEWTRDPTASLAADTLPWDAFERPLRTLGDLAPFLTDVSVQLRQLTDPRQDRSWAASEPGPSPRIWLEPPAAAAPDSVLASVLPSTSGRWDYLWFLALVVALLGIGATVYWAACRVFFIHLEHSRPLRLRDALPRRGGEWSSLILIGTRSMSRAPLRNLRAEVEYVDLLTIGRDGDGLPALGLDIGRGRKAVCIDNFEHRLGEPAWNRRVLEFLERRLSSGDSIPIVLLTSRDPEEILFGSPPDVELSREDRRRWERVLGRFMKHILADVEDPDDFRTAVDQRIAEALRSELRDEFVGIRELQKGGGGAIRHWRIQWRLGVAEAKLDWLAVVRKADGGDPPADPRTGAPIETDPTALDDRIDVVGRILAADGAIDGATERSDREGSAGGSSAPARVALEAGTERNMPESASPHPTSRAGTETEDSPEREHDRGFGRIPVPGIVAYSGVPLVRSVTKRIVGRQRRRIEALREVLIHECGHRPRLKEIGRRILGKPDLLSLEPDEVIDLVREWGDSFYAARWAILTEREKLVAGQLAAGAAVNPRSRLEVTRLYARGFVEREPELRLDTESFTRFVQDRTPPALLHEWEHAGASSRWEMIRGPLVLAWIGIALFLFWAQRDLLSNTVALLTTVGAGLAVVLRLVSSFERGSPSSGSDAAK